jgi:hypothetical protein
LHSELGGPWYRVWTGAGYIASTMIRFTFLLVRRESLFWLRYLDTRNTNNIGKTCKMWSSWWCDYLNRYAVFSP